MTLIEALYNETKKFDFTQCTGTASPRQKSSMSQLDDRRQLKEQNCDNREHREVVTAWVESSFDETISSLNSLSKISSIWQQAFSAIKAITEKRIIHRDISFQNIRIDDQNNLKVCDFDMATFLDSQGIGAEDRAGTIAFMATSILRSKPYMHRPIHDCESVFWLCTLELLSRIGTEETEKHFTSIMSPSRSIWLVNLAKTHIITTLNRFKSEHPRLESYVSLDGPKNSSLFFCITALMREFARNDYHEDYYEAEEGIENNCFDRCIDIIKQALEIPVQQISEGIATTSLSC